MAAGDSFRKGGETGSAKDLDRGVLTLAAWGFVAVMAVVTGFAAWQFAPRETMQSTRGGADEVTAAIGPARAPAPRPSSADLQGVMRELETVRQEILELRRLMGRADQKSDLLSQRITLVEDQAAILTAGLTAMAQRGTATDASRAVAPETPRAAPDEPTAAARTEAPRPADGARVAVTVPLPDPRPPGAEIRTTDPKVVAEPRSAPAAVPTQPAPAAPGAAPARLAPMPSVAIGLRPPGAADKPGEPVSAPETTGAIPPKAEHGVDLGGFRNLTQLRKAWTDLEARQPRLAKGMAPLAQARETTDGLEVRLIGGPFPTPADAARFCTAARAAGVACAPSGYAGQPAR